LKGAAPVLGGATMLGTALLGAVAEPNVGTLAARADTPSTTPPTGDVCGAIIGRATGVVAVFVVAGIGGSGGVWYNPAIMEQPRSRTVDT